MMTATYFGEITELDSRAVWYSDEEDEDEDEDEDGLEFKTPKIKSIEPLNYERFRADVQVKYSRTSSLTNMDFDTCVIGLCSNSQFKNMKSTVQLIGNFESYGKAFAFPMDTCQSSTGKHLLWLIFDASSPLIVGYQVGFFAEKILKVLHDEFKFDYTSQVVILSQQFTNSDNLEYLSNFKSGTTAKLPFVGQQILPPSLIKNQFESSLFEQLTLSMEPALVVCLPDPKKFWFDRTKSWPSIPNLIIEHKLNDDNLEKTLIFT